jgi:cytochrome b
MIIVLTTVDVMQKGDQIKVWDLAVRTFHWSLVVFFIVAYLTGEEENQLHNQAGYVVLALIVFRIIWGVIGPRYARFQNFVHSPGHTLAYACSLLSGNPRHYLGHNPLGGWMVVALLVSLLLTTWSGLELEASVGRGPLAENLHAIQSVYADEDRHEREKEHEREEDREGNEFWEELHEALANLTVMLVFIHVAGVLFSSFVHRENLTRSMMTGYKSKKSD